MASHSEGDDAYETFYEGLFERNKVLLKKISTVNTAVNTLLEGIAKTGRLKTKAADGDHFFINAAHVGFANTQPDLSHYTTKLIEVEPQVEVQNMVHQTPLLVNCSERIEESSAMTPNWGSPSVKPVHEDGRGFSATPAFQRGQYSRKGTARTSDQSETVRETANSAYIKAEDIAKEFHPLIDTLEVEPLVMLHQIQQGIQKPQPELLNVISLLYRRAAREIRNIYRRQAIRPICILGSGEIGFRYKSSKVKGEVKFVVPLNGSSVRVEAANGSVIESYKLNGSESVPRNHAVRYDYLRNALRMIRAAIPRVFVADCISRCAATLGSYRWPGLHIEMFRTHSQALRRLPTEGISDSQLDEMDAREALCHIISTGVRYSIFCIKLKREEETNQGVSHNQGPGVTPGPKGSKRFREAMYYATETADRAGGGSMCSSFAVTTPSPIYEAAASLWRQWHESARPDGGSSSFRLHTPEMSTISRKGERRRDLSDLERWFRQCDIGGGQGYEVEVEFARADEAKHPDVKYTRVIWSLASFMAGAVGATSVQSDRDAPNGGVYENKAVANDYSMMKQLYDATLSAFVDNLPILVEVQNKNVDVIRMYHEIVQERGGDVSVVEAHRIYENLFPVTALLNSKDWNESQQESYDREDWLSDSRSTSGREEPSYVSRQSAYERNLHQRDSRELLNLNFESDDSWLD